MEGVNGFLICDYLRQSANHSSAIERIRSLVSNREIATDIIGRMPEEASLYEIARRIEFVAAVREGLADLERGEGMPLEQVERELPEWIIE